MGETTCLLQPFSYAAGMSSNEATEGNRFHGLGQSVSFGRFMSESLSWEKWSTFSHNKYVEEAERYSRPGSVAQMKAFFEAHYKNLAARKAAALLEQANSAASNVPEPQHEGVIRDNATQDSRLVTKSSEEDSDKQVHVEEMSTEPVARSDDIQGNNQAKNVDPSTVGQVLVENAIKIEPSSQLGVVDEEEEVKEMDITDSKQMEKPLLRDFMSNEQDSASMSKKKPPVSSTKSLIHSRASKLSSSPAKPAAYLGARRENIATPICRKLAIEHLDRKKSTPKSNHKSMNFTPVRELNRITSTIIQKIDDSRACSSSNASKDFPTPLRTPTMQVSALKKPKQPLATPQAENRRPKTPLQASASGGKTVRRRWNFLPTDCSKVLTHGTNKAQSPKISTPFSFRTEERAARRKEKLEEKFNADQAQKAQLQATMKEKAEAKLKKLGQNLCFKARPLPRFYKERSTTNNQMEKVPLAHFHSPDLGSKSSPTVVENTSHRLPRRSTKTGSKQATCRKSHIPHSLGSRPKTRTTLENTSPNIQRN